MGVGNIREKIDKLDKKLVALLNKRAHLALRAKEEKKQDDLDIYSPEREKQIFHRVKKLNKGPLEDSSLYPIFRQVISSCLALQRPLKISYLGPKLTFTYQAAVNKFGPEVEYNSCSSISFVFSEVEKSHSDYGVVPIENSTEGIISHTLDMFINSDLKICSEMLFEISHFLLSDSDKLENIKKVYSKSEVFGQCREWLEERLPRVQLCEASSTSEAAEIASREEGSAAIASKAAATEYSLNILAEEIQDYDKNLTRFLIIGKTIPGPSGHDKTSIMFSIKDKVGALHDILVPFKENGINLTKIESRPSKRKLWEYYFFVDFQGHCENENVKKALQELKENCKSLKILGSYPYEIE